MPPRIWDTDTWVAEIAKVRAELGWAPVVSLEEGFARTVEWLRANPRLWERYQVRPAPAPTAAD